MFSCLKSCLIYFVFIETSAASGNKPGFKEPESCWLPTWQILIAYLNQRWLEIWKTDEGQLFAFYLVKVQF